MLVPGVVHGEDGAEVHGVHVVGGPVHELADDDPVGALSWVVGVPEHVLVPLGADVGQRGAQPDPVVRPLPTARLGSVMKSKWMRKVLAAMNVPSP